MPPARPGPPGPWGAGGGSCHWRSAPRPSGSPRRAPPARWPAPLGRRRRPGPPPPAGAASARHRAAVARRRRPRRSPRRGGGRDVVKLWDPLRRNLSRRWLPQAQYPSQSAHDASPRSPSSPSFTMIGTIASAATDPTRAGPAQAIVHRGSARSTVRSAAPAVIETH